MFSEDFNQYPSVKDAVENGLVESICYLSIKRHV